MRFRAYVLDEWGYAIEMADIECESPGRAMERAKRMVKDRPVELWNGPRRIARYTPPDWRPFEVR